MSEWAFVTLWRRRFPARSRYISTSCSTTGDSREPSEMWWVILISGWLTRALVALCSLQPTGVWESHRFVANVKGVRSLIFQTFRTVLCDSDRHVAKYGDLYSELVFCIYPSKVHTPWTHTRSSRQPFRGFCALLKGTSVVILKVERECCTFTPPTYNSYRPETRSRNLWVTSLTLTIRTRLPTAQKIMGHFFPCIESKWRLGFLTSKSSKSCEFGPTWGRLLFCGWGNDRTLTSFWDGNKVSLGFD